MPDVARLRIPCLAQAPDSSPRRDAVTGLRALGATLVFLVHYVNYFAPYLDANSFSSEIAEFLAKLGRVGTGMFFVLSGYLVYGMLLRTPVNYLRFLRRRIQRLYPAFLCVLALYVLVSLLFPTFSRLPATPVQAVYYVAQNVALLPGVFPIHPVVSVTWTLSYEFLWYLTIPLLVHATGLRAWRSPQRMVFVSALAVLYLASCTLYPRLEMRAVLYFVGVLLYEALHSASMARSLTPAGECGTLLGFLAIFPITTLLQAQGMSGVLNPGPVLSATLWRTLALALGLFCLMAYGFGRAGALQRLLSWRPALRLGTISYSFYLSHGLAVHGVGFFLGWLAAPTGHHPWVFWAGLPVTYGAALALAAVLYHHVEKRYSTTPRPAAPSAEVPREVPRPRTHQEQPQAVAC